VANASRGNFYYHFKSNDGILSAVVASRMAAISSGGISALRGVSSATRRYCWSSVATCRVSHGGWTND